MPGFPWSMTKCTGCWPFRWRDRPGLPRVKRRLRHGQQRLDAMNMMKFAPLLGLLAISANAQTVTCTAMFNQVNCSKVQTDNVSPIVNAMKATAEASQKSAATEGSTGSVSAAIST
jgi:hypothetical protein